MHRLFQHKWANIAIIERFKAQQCLICRVSLVCVQRQTKPWRALADGFYACYIVPNIASNFDFDAVYPSCHYILCKFIAMFRRHHRDTHICFDEGTGATKENKER